MYIPQYSLLHSISFISAFRPSISDDWSSTGMLPDNEADPELASKLKLKREKEREKERAKVEKEKEYEEGT